MLFLRTCKVCGRELVEGERKLCLACLAKAPCFAASTDDLRWHRLPRTAPIAGVWPWLTYTNADPICAIIREGKFNDRPDLIEELGRIYAAWLEERDALAGVDCLVAVPMHWLKRLMRGYNQASLIARAISRHTGIPVAKGLRAVRSHAVQSRRSGQERAANVKGIFALSADFPHGQSIAVVDDILTTGSTLSEAVSTLMQSAPRAITVLSLAAAPH